MSFGCDANQRSRAFLSPFGVLSQASGDGQLLAPSPQQDQEQGDLDREKAVTLFPLQCYHTLSLTTHNNRPAEMPKGRR
jgi:hypothetical protein